MWSPQPGPQTEAIRATWCSELFFGGARGGGKSDYLLADFLQDVPTYGHNWRGVLFRRTFPELQELILRSRTLFINSGAVWREKLMEWCWPNGAFLRMRYLESVDDASRYQGHQYTWIGWDELTQWPTDEGYGMIFACLRNAEEAIPTKRIRASGNPGGPGHGWVKARFIDPAPLGYVPHYDAETEMWRMFIPSKLHDNRALMQKDPTYQARLKAVGSPQLVKAWLEGDWNVVTGAFFPEFGEEHIVRPVPLPKHWTRFGGFDFGSARPFSFHWFAVSDGLDDNNEPSQFPKNSIVIYREDYGCSAPNKGLSLTAEEIADRILAKMPPGESLSYVAADPACWKEEGGPSIAERMMQRGLSSLRKADNSRIAGWDQLRARLKGEDGKPMLYVFSTCEHLIRTIPLLQHDQRRPEDIDTDGEDHAGDSTRYGLMSRPYASTLPVKQKESAMSFYALAGIRPQ
jgi:hypothetical protein